MQEKTVFKLHFTGPLHIGKGLGEAYDTTDSVLHSDTLSGLIASVWSMQNGGEGLRDFMDRYRVSSAFPFFQSFFFLPVPVGNQSLTIAGIDSEKAAKMLKTIEYIPVDGWQKVVSGEKVEFSYSALSPCGRFLFPENEKGLSIYSDELEQRVTVPRDGDGDAVPFYFERRFFAKNSGLYFFCDANSETLNEIYELLEIAGTIGVGTDKSVGNGQFTVEKTKLTFDREYENPGAYQLLSLYCPSREELGNVNLEMNRYQLLKRGGFIAGTNRDEFRHLRKKSLYMFSEGGLFTTHEPVGKIENVRPDWNDEALHPVFRDGRAFCLPVK